MVNSWYIISQGFTKMDAMKEALNFLEYNSNGTFTWRNLPHRRDRIGKIAGSLSSTDGYVYIKFRSKRYSAHKLVFMLHFGYLPDEIDHINRIRNDNRVENLRPCVHSENIMNRSKQRLPTSSKFKGVCWDKNRNSWMASIKINKKLKYLGRFSSEVEAAEAYNKAALRMFGEFANINKLSD